jgi:hypothetical protein
MPTNRITMRQIRETLRLHLSAGLSYNEVGRSLRISKSVAAKYGSLARAAGVDWAVALTLTDEELEARLYRPALPRSSHQVAPDFASVHQELKRVGVMLLYKSLACPVHEQLALLVERLDWNKAHVWPRVTASQMAAASAASFLPRFPESR